MKVSIKALTGIMKAFEDATGEPLDEEKKELASEELIITGDIGEDIGQDKATGIINDIKTEIIKNGTSDTIQIADTINNITNNYNVTLTPEQQQHLESLMLKIAKQDYDYNEMKNALESVKDSVNGKLEELGEEIKNSFFDSVKEWFVSIGDWFKGLFYANQDSDLGILGGTNDELLGENAIIDSTNKEAINLQISEDNKGFFKQLWDWIVSVFDNTDSKEESGNEINGNADIGIDNEFEDIDEVKKENIEVDNPESEINGLENIDDKTNELDDVNDGMQDEDIIE